MSPAAAILRLVALDGASLRHLEPTTRAPTLVAWLALNVSVDLMSAGTMEDILAAASPPAGLEVDIARVRNAVWSLRRCGELP
jgi:hypothetical protein